MSTFWAIVTAILTAFAKSMFSIVSARRQGAADEVARRNKKIAAAQERAAAVPTRNVEDAARDLDKGAF